MTGSLPQDDATLTPGPVLPFEDLLFACTHLCDLLEIENEALAGHDSETVRVLIDNKTGLARLYEQAVKPLVATPELAETLEPEEREALFAVGSRLNQLMTVNARYLKAEIEAYQRLMDIVVDAARKAKTDGSAIYGRGGSFDTTGPAGTSISFNKAL